MANTSKIKLADFCEDFIAVKTNYGSHKDKYMHLQNTHKETGIVTY